MAETKTLWVRAIKGLDDPRPGEHRVILFEQDSRHPVNGEAFIAGPVPVEVAETPEVSRLIRDGQIEEVSASEAKKAQPRASVTANADMENRARELETQANNQSQREQTLQAKETDLEQREKELAAREKAAEKK